MSDQHEQETEAPSPADTTADAELTAAVEPAVRTVYPAGWPAEVLDAIDPALAQAVESLVGVVDGVWHRLRPARVLEEQNPSRVPCMIVSSIGGVLPSDRSIPAVQPYADARGIWVIRLDDERFALSLAAPEVSVSDFADEPAVEPTPRRRRVS